VKHSLDLFLITLNKLLTGFDEQTPQPITITIGTKIPGIIYILTINNKSILNKYY